MITYKEALEIIVNWPQDYEEIILPQILAFANGILANDEDAIQYLKVVEELNSSERIPQIPREKYDFLRSFENKYSENE